MRLAHNALDGVNADIIAVHLSKSHNKVVTIF
jgi:hypothetical protein